MGAALGYLLGGLLGDHLGWRAAFFWVGLPGLALAACGMLLPDPRRGAFDPPAGGAGSSSGAGVGAGAGSSSGAGAGAGAGAGPCAGPAPGGRPAVSAAPPAAPPSPAALYRALWRNRRYVWTVAGYTAYTFALGGMAFWMPTYIIRVHHQAQAHGMVVFGGLTVATGICGTLLGGWLGDVLRRRHPNGYVHLNILSMLAAAAAATGALCAPTFPLWMAATAATQIFAFLSVGPVNAILIDAVPAAGRATATAVCIFFIHLLGDAISPLIIGALSDRYGIQSALMMVPAVFLVAAALWRPSLRIAPATSSARRGEHPSG